MLRSRAVANAFIFLLFGVFRIFIVYLCHVPVVLRYDDVFISGFVRELTILNMKRQLHNSLRALFLSLAVLLSLPMLAVEVEIDGINYDLVAKAKQATVIAKSSGKYSGEVVIPESVEHEGTAYSVTSIGDRAFYGCYNLTEIPTGLFDSVQGAQIELADERADKTSLAQKYADENSDPINAAKDGYIDAIIEPQFVKQYLIASLQMLAR